MSQGLRFRYRQALEMRGLPVSVFGNGADNLPGRKRPIRDYLLAIAIFVNGAKGHSALQLSRDLDCPPPG
jgi:hypothetical protein